MCVCVCVCVVVVDVVVVSACLLVVFNSQQHSVEVNICHELKPRNKQAKTNKQKEQKTKREMIKIDFLPFRIQK